MAADLQPLVQKIQTAENLSLEDFSEFIKAVREALADGRIRIFEMIRLAGMLMDLLEEIGGAFQNSGQPAPDLEFLRQS